jgi:NhaA family Na+:H+ antiporter
VRPFQDPAVVSEEAILTAAETDDHPDDPDADAASWSRLSWLSREAISPLARVEDALHGWSSFVVLPIFALANAGIVLDSESIDAATQTPVALAVGLGLIVGKTVGLTAGVALAVRLGLSSLPPGVRWPHVVGTGALAGIGFTVSLFIADLSFTGTRLNDAKVGILIASIVAGALGAAVLTFGRRSTGSGPESPEESGRNA